MKIYLQSCGFTQDDDYSWLKITETGQSPEIPVILRKTIPTTNGNQILITDLIQSESPSILIARIEHELLLLVTGLKAKERRDFRGREVRNSLALITDNSDESVIRVLAASALRELLKDEIDDLIRFGGEWGFEVSSQAINQLIEKYRQEYPGVGLANQDYRVGKNSQNTREYLAFELEDKQLPHINGVLVVVTGIKTEENLQNAQVWRGLSNLVVAQGWKEPYKTDFTPSAYNQTTQTKEDFFNILLIFLKITAIAGISVIIIALLLLWILM